MASAKQLAANRANAAKSTGPITEAGKLNSRRNAVKHGLTGHTVLRTPEQDATYNTYRARLYPDLAPANAMELDFAERIIYDSWRIHRASAIESNLYALVADISEEDALNEAHAFQVNEKSIALLSLYQQRLQRSSTKISPCSVRCRRNANLSRNLYPQMLSFVGASAAARAPQLAPFVPSLRQPLPRRRLHP